MERAVIYRNVVVARLAETDQLLLAADLDIKRIRRERKRLEAELAALDDGQLPIPELAPAA